MRINTKPFQLGLRTEVFEEGNTLVSTVWLPIMHIGGQYESLVFGGENDGMMKRYHTRKEAEKGHKQMVKDLRNS